MARRRFCWIQGGSAGVAVLYSVVVGAVREFWVKTATADVKVAEIPLTIPYVPMTSIGGVGASATFGGTTNERRGYNLLKDLTGIVPENGYFRLTGTYSFVWTGPTTPPGGTGNSAWSNASVDQDHPNVGRVGWSAIFGLSTEAFGGWGNDGVFIMPEPSARSSSGGLLCAQGFFNWSYIGTDDTYSPSATWTITVTLSEYVGPSTIPNDYTAWISSHGDELFVTIKDGVDLECGFTDNDGSSNVTPTVESVHKTKLSLLDGNGDGVTYDFDDPVTIRDANWRNTQESFSVNAFESDDLCVNEFSSNNFVNLIEGNLYSINPNQFIDGQTLRSRLQSSPDTVTATLITQSATSGETCIRGTATTSTVQVPSPGRGTVEGITYLP